MSVDADYARFAETMAPWVRRAAEVARDLEGRVPNSPKLEESTAVKQALTAADTASQEVILEGLHESFPQVALAAEEDTTSVEKFAQQGEALVVIDPIDGTLHSYLQREGPYAVIVGLALRGCLESALVALPREGLLFYAGRGEGAMMARAGGEPKPVRARAEGNRILVSNGMPPAVSASLRARGYEVVAASGGAVAVAPLIPGVRAGLRHASGDLGVSIRGRVGTLIAREAGARVCSDTDRPFPNDLESPANVLRVAASDDDLAVLHDALEEAGLP